MVTVARMKNDATLLLAGEIDERVPAITNGLIAHFPFDGRGGAVDPYRMHQTKENVETGVNLIEAMDADWRDPLNWATRKNMVWDESKQALKITGYHPTWLNTPIVIDPNKRYEVSFTVMVESRPDNQSLYLGGHCMNANKERVTRNYDYSAASNAKPALGEWTTYRITRTGTGAILSRTSYTFDTVNGWMGDSVSATDLMTKYYQMGGLFNYSTGEGVTYLKDLSVRVVNDDTSNSKITDDGIYLERRTENLSSKTIQIYNNYGVPATLRQLDETYNGQPVYRLGMKVDDARASYLSNFQSSLSSHGVFVPGGSFLAGKRYAASIFWRPVNKSDVVFGGTATNMGNWRAGPTHYFEDGWRRYTRFLDGTMTDNRSDSIHHSFYCPSLKLNETVYIDVCCPQIEIDTIFPSAYVDGVRSSPGQLSIPLEKDLVEYTVFGKFIPNTPLKDNVSYEMSTPNSATLLRIQDNVNTGGFFLRYYLSGVRAAAYLDHDGNYGTQHIHNYYEISEGVPVYYLIRKVGTSLKMKFFQGSWKSEHSTTVPANAVLSELIYGGGSAWEGKHSDVHVYNRSLSDNEANQLIQSKGSVSPLGDLIKANVVEEMPTALPSDAIHIPLDVDDKDRLKLVSAAEVNNLVYEDGAAWVGSGHNNLVTNVDLSPHAPYHDYSRNGNVHTFVMKGNSPVVFQIPGYSPVGKTLALRGKMKRNGKPIIFTSKVASTYNYTADNLLKNFDSTSGEFSVVEKYFDKPWIFHTYFDGMVAGDVITIEDLQVVEKNFSVPFVRDSVGKGSLEYNLYRDYELDWSGDWSIVYWKKPIATSDNTKTGYNIDSLGANSNSVGGGYVWFGKNSGANANSRPSYAIDPAKYFGEWQMVFVVKRGNVITYGNYSPGHGMNSTTETNNITKPNYYVNQYGYDLKLSGWDHVYASNSWFRDLIVAKRGFSTEELEALYKNKMTVKKGKLLVGLHVHEGATL